MYSVFGLRGYCESMRSKVYVTIIIIIGFGLRI